MSKRFFSCSGTRKRKIFESYFTENGSRQLRLVGEDDLYDYIQSFKESTDMVTILKRFQLGDTSVLSVNRGMYGNFTEAPKSLSEFLNAQIKAQALFDRLPAEMRSQFNNDVNKFFVEFGSESWLQAVSPFIQKPVVSNMEDHGNES